MWTGITIAVPNQDTEDAVVQLLLDSGCAGVALSGDGLARSVTSYIPTDENTDDRIRQISAALSMLPLLGLSAVGAPAIQQVDELDWANAWKAYFKPIRIGRRLFVSPPWESPKLEDRDLLITIDPGMAFGTGTHGTTQLCMSLIEEYIQPGDSVADIGTGSGILSISAVKLGASSVTAVDNDPLAVKIATENSEVNNVSVQVSGEFPFGKVFDLVVANIIADTLIELSDELAAITKPEGILIVSGIIDSRQDDVRIFFEGSGFYSLETRTSGEWVALVFRRATL